MTTSVLKMQRELVAVTEERDRLAAELQKLREQKPVATVEIMTSEKHVQRIYLDHPLPSGSKLFAAPVAAPAYKKCAGCNGHGMLGNGHPDCSDVVCHFCGGTGVDSPPAAQAPAPAVSAPSVPNNEFVQHLKKCKQDVESWPEWKKRAAGGATSVSEEALFNEWFQSQQGVPYDGMWAFAKSAWMHRALLQSAPQPDKEV